MNRRREPRVPVELFDASIRFFLVSKFFGHPPHKGRELILNEENAGQRHRASATERARLQLWHGMSVPPSRLEAYVLLKRCR